MPDNTVKLISHPNHSFEGARNLYTTTDGWLLAVSRRPLFDACTRLLQEKMCNSDSMVMLVDCADAAPPICGRVSDVLEMAKLVV